MICSIEGCGWEAVARGWCHTHYKRWQVHGDPDFVMHVRPRDGVLDDFLASIPNDGTGCVTWPGTTNNQGYATMKRKGLKSRLVSRYMCGRRNGPPPTPNHQAAHICGKGHKGCIAPWHLEWKTPKENMADTKAHGTYNFGEKAPWAKLTEADVIIIKSLLGKESQRKIGDRFGVTQTLISRISLGKVWAHV